MPKNTEGGSLNPPESTPAADNGPGASSGGNERRGPARLQSEARAAEIRAGNGSSLNPASSDAQPTPAPPHAGGKSLGERKKQFLIAPRQAEALAPMGLSPLSFSAVEQALRSSPDIDIVDTVTPRSAMGTLSAGMGGGQGILVARMTDQKAGVLHMQGQGRLMVERDQYLGLMDAQLQPSYVSNIAPHSGPAFTASFTVLGRDGAPVAEAEVSMFGSMLPATAVTDENGSVTLSLFGESAASIRSIYVKPKADYWSFYQRDPDISADEPNTIALKALSDWPSLAGFPRQKTVGWGQKAMRMDQLPTTYRGQGIKIAVIDSGAATTHEALNRIQAGFDIVNKKTTPDTWNQDTLGHGSHCAGVIGGTELAFGIRGFAPEAELHVCKLFPGGQVSQLIDALEYCIEKGIDVVNLSLGGAEPSEALEQQIIRAKRAGIACIVAAGNSGGAVQYPASSPNVLAVAAIGKLDEFPPDSYHAQTLTSNVDANGYFAASFSCFGPQIGVCGPGVAITSSVPPNNYAAWDGTSMAAPHITGLAALVLAHHPEFQGIYRTRSAERVERLFQVIRASAHRVSLADPGRIGLGLPDAITAVGLQPAMASQGLGAQSGAIGSLLGAGQGVGQQLGQQFGQQLGQQIGALMGGMSPFQQFLGGQMSRPPMGMQAGPGGTSALGMPIGMPLGMPYGLPAGMPFYAGFGTGGW